MKKEGDKLTAKEGNEVIEELDQLNRNKTFLYRKLDILENHIKELEKKVNK